MGPPATSITIYYIDFHEPWFYLQIFLVYHVIHAILLLIVGCVLLDLTSSSIVRLTYFGIDKLTFLFACLSVCLFSVCLALHNCLFFGRTDH